MHPTKIKNAVDLPKATDAMPYALLNMDSLDPLRFFVFAILRRSILEGVAADLRRSRA